MKIRTALASLAAALPLTALAFGPSDYVYVPAVTYGEHEIDFKAGHWKLPEGTALSAASIGYG